MMMMNIGEQKGWRIGVTTYAHDKSVALDFDVYLPEGDPRLDLSRPVTHPTATSLREAMDIAQEIAGYTFPLYEWRAFSSCVLREGDE